MLLSARIALAACKIFFLSPRHNLAQFVLGLGCDISRCRNGNLAAVLKLKGRIALNNLGPLNCALSDVQELCRFAIRLRANS